MSGKARDVRFGRRGGHWIDGDGTPPPPPRCTVCGRHVHVAGTRPDIHLSCERCTDVDAEWCPIHGDCTCRMIAVTKRRTHNDDGCPLHADTAEHRGVAPTQGSLL